MDKCTPTKSNISFIFNVGIHVFILFAFLSCFFIFYISKLMSSAFSQQINDLVKQNVSKVLDKYSYELRPVVGSLPLEQMKNFYNTPSEAVQEHNKGLFINVLIVNIAILLIISASAYLIYKTCNQCVPLVRIIIENVIIFSFIGGIEYLFFTKIAFNYIPVPPSLMVTSMLNSLATTI